MNYLSNISPERRARMEQVFRRTEEQKAETKKRDAEERKRQEGEQRNKPEDSSTQTTSPVSDTTTNQPLQVNSDLKDYIQVGMAGIHGVQVVISPFELQGYNNLNYEKTHFKLLENGLYMPTPRIFMKHFNNLLEAKEGKRKLFYADGTREVEPELIEEMYKHLTTNFKDVYGSGQAGAWTWLNAKFVRGNGFNDMDLETITGIEGGKLKSSRWNLLENLDETCYFDFNRVNSQGLADKGSKDSNQDYVKGQNVYFWKPELNRVAWFYAGSVRAVLGCVGDPSDSSSSLGVFACAEGTAGANLGVRT